MHRSITFMFLLLSLVVQADVPETIAKFFPTATKVEVSEDKVVRPIEKLTNIHQGFMTIGWQVEIESKAKSGKYEMVLLVDNFGEIKNLEIISHKGPHGHTVKYSNVIGNYAGQNLHDFINPKKEKKVDVISGATSSSQSIHRAITRVARQLKAKLFKPVSED